MSGTASKSGPKLSTLKFLVEKILYNDADTTIMKIGDQNALGKVYALKVVKRVTHEEQEAQGPKDRDDAKRTPKPEELQAAFEQAIDQARTTFEASQKLGHPVPLKYHDFRTKKSWFKVARGELLMEYVNGLSLDKLPRPAVSPAVLIAKHVAAGMAHMHRRGVLHGGLSPSHVILARAGQVRILGYGHVKTPGAPLSRAARLYAAPEQIREGTVDDKSEVYAFGATFYHFLTGKSPNSGKRADGEASKIPLPSALNPAIPANLSNVLVSCLQSTPDRRPESMFAVSEQLDEIVRKLELDDDVLRGIADAPEA